MRLFRSMSRSFCRINLRRAKSYKFSSVISMDKDLDDKYDEGVTIKALTTKVLLKFYLGIEKTDQA